jgi:predicted nucleotide-binding protein (sugar kinase/HSP70/actin superfamily)
MKVVNAYLSAKEGFTPGEMEAKIEAILDILDKKGVAVVTREDIEILESVEHEEARKRKTWDFKFTSDDQMLQVIRERKAAR